MPRGNVWQLRARLLEDLRRDARFALRAFRRSPGFTAIAIATLALGIGANTAVFSLIDAVLLKPLPYRAAKQLLLISSDASDPAGGVTLDSYERIRADGNAFSDLAVFYRNSGWSRVTLSSTGEPEAVQGAFVSASFFPVMGVPPAVGRWLALDDERAESRVVVLSHDLWMRRFGGSSGIVGSAIQIDGVDAQVIGVMPARFQFPASETQFWAPITTNRYWRDPSARTYDQRRSPGFYLRWTVVGRLATGISLQKAQGELDRIARDLKEAEPSSSRPPGLFALPLRVDPSGSTRLALFVLFGAVGFVLLIACTNLANLLLARGKAREREMALRLAIGASRGRLIRQMLTESALLAVGGGVVGLVLGALGIRALIAFGPHDIPRLEQAGFDGWVLLFTCGACLLAASLFGMAPARELSGRNPGEMLKSGGKGLSGDSGMRYTRDVLVVVELALAVTLLAGAGLLLRSLHAAQSVDPGFRPERVLTMQIALPSGAPPTRRKQVIDLAVERLASTGGVRYVGAIDGLFDLGEPQTLAFREVEGRTSEPRAQWTAMMWKTVSGDYFQAMGTPLIRGRLFTSADGADAPLVAVVDESTARRYWRGEDPIGKRFKGQDPRGRNDDWVTVIGVVSDTRREGVERSPTATVYQWHAQADVVLTHIVARTSGDPRAFAASLRATVRSIDGSAILSPVSSLEQELAAQLAPRRFQTALLALFAILAVVLASVGLYGVMHFSVAQRTREIGIRVALGAPPRRVLEMVLGHVARLALAGLAIGLVGAWWLTQFLTNLLFGVHAGDPIAFVGASTVLLVAAVLGGYLPAWRATRVDPVVALREQ